MIATPVLDRRPSVLDIGLQRLVGLVEVSLEGSLVEGTVDELCRALERLLAEGATAVEVDCTEVVDIDGFGLALLLDAHRQLSHSGGSLVLRYAQPAVLDRLCAARLDDILLAS